MASSPPVPPHATAVPLEADWLETDMIAPRDNRKRWTVLIAVGGIAAVLALVVGTRASRHAPPQQARAPEPVVAPAPLPVAPLAPQPAQLEIALDPAGAPGPTAAPVAVREEAADEAPRAQAHRRGQPRVLRATRALKPWPAPDRGSTLDRDPTHTAYQRGNSLLSAGNAAGAIAAYEEVVRLAPSDPDGYRGLGLAYEKLGKTNEAVAALASCLKLSHRARDRELIARRLYRLTHPADN
jgi:Tetratricopeptide repeat